MPNDSRKKLRNFKILLKWLQPWIIKCWEIKKILQALALESSKYL
jgi:hypothetical protein